MPRGTESVLCAIIAVAIVGTVTVYNELRDMRLESDQHVAASNEISTGDVAATNTSAHWIPVDVKRGYVAGPPGSNWFHYVSNERDESKDVTECIKTILEQEDTRMTRVHARLALSVMEYAIRSGREGELIGIIGDFLAKGVKEEGAK